MHASLVSRSVEVRLCAFFRFLGLTLVILFASVSLSAQINTGRILGTVTDQSGGAVAGAMVTVTNVDTNVTRNLVTDESGEYLAPNLNAGKYSVKATSAGFQTFERQNVNLQVGADARVDCQLTPGQVTQTIQVTENALQLDTTSAVVSGSVGGDTIADLPMKARNFQDLLSLRPGVVQTPGGGTLTTAVHGLAPSQNSNFIEGLDSNDPLTGQNITNTTLPWGDAATILPVDAIQELNVETNAPAEFGRRPGAVINVGLKTGGNTIHGDAFAYGRDSALNANDFVNSLGGPPSLKQPMNLEQYGGTFGGPVKKDKLFYFGAFERETYSVGNAAASSTPTSNPNSTDPSQGIVPAEAALATAGIPLNPLSLHLLQYFGPNNNPNSNIILGPGQPTSFTINNGVGKMDYHPTDHHTFTAGYFYGGGDTTGGYDAVYTLQQFDSIGKMRAEFLTTSWTWTPNSTWVNDLRFGWNHYLRNTQTGDFKTPASTYGLNTGITDPQLQGFPLVTISDFSSSAGGGPKSPRNFGPGSDYDIVDHVSYLHGKHAFKFGGEILYLHTFFDQIPNGRGTFTFTGGKLAPLTGAIYNGVPVVNPLGTNITALEAYLAGWPDVTNGGSLLEGSPARTYTQWDFSGFLEDSYRVTSKVTATMGLRYEYFTPIQEIHNLIGNWDQTLGFEQVGLNGLKHAYNAYPKDISPRVGVAWDISGKGTTVIRAGFGLYYDNPASAQFIGLQGTLPGGQIGIDAIPTGSLLYGVDGSHTGPIAPNGSGMSTQTVQVNGANLNWVLNGANPIFPAFDPTKLACGNGKAPVNPVPGAPATNPGGCSIFATSPNLPSPQILSWNLGVQHTLSSTLSMDVNYIGNHGGRLPGVTDLNQANQTTGALPFATAYPYLAYVDFMQNNEVSNYDGLEATLNARNFHHLSFLAGYSYSHALTEEPGTGYGLASPQNNLNPMGDYGPTNFDVRHHFSFTPSYTIPGRKAPLQLLEGWSIQSAVLMTTGLPWNASTTKNLSGSTEKKDRWDFFGSPSDFTQTSSPIPFFPGTVKVSGNTVFNPNMPAPCITEGTLLGTYNPATTATVMAGNLAKLGCFMQGNSIMIAPPPNTFGNAARNMFRGPDYIDWDFSLFKNIKFTERLTAQFRAEAYNILNHKILYQGNTNPANGSSFGCACETPDQAQTNPVLGLGGARNLQFGLKLMF
jgi:hypothetical protein